MFNPEIDHVQMRFEVEHLAISLRVIAQSKQSWQLKQKRKKLELRKKQWELLELLEQRQKLLEEAYKKLGQIKELEQRNELVKARKDLEKTQEELERTRKDLEKSISEYGFSEHLLSKISIFLERIAPHTWQKSSFYFHDIVEDHRENLIPSYRKHGYEWIANLITGWRLLFFFGHFGLSSLRSAITTRRSKL
jgi:DNA repair exonuclease SbcCD ATPase subunit